MIDYWLSNSDWYDRTLPTGSLYEGKTIRSGSPRCDILVNDILKSRVKVRRHYNLPPNVKILMYAPTFRGGSQGTDRTISASQDFPDYKRLKQSLETRFGGKWYIFLRLHPQLVARNLDIGMDNTSIVDVSRADDMYEILAGCDAFITDYSSAAFDAAVMRIPIFLYADDYANYEGERGKLLWDLRKLPFPLALTNNELEKQILDYNETTYHEKLEQLFKDTVMLEDGQASKRVVDEMEKFD
jgi:CDP-glycerol glycerophosphotransferase